MLRFFTLALLCTLGCSVRAQTLEEQERANLLNKIETLKRGIPEKVEQMTADKKAQCLSAIANPGVCMCLSEQLPAIVNFIQYVAIVSKSKAELNYDALTADQKIAVDTARAARDKCIRRGRYFPGMNSEKDRQP